MSDFFQGNKSSVHRMMGEHRKVTRMLERARGENGARVRVHNGRLIISASGVASASRARPFRVSEINNETGTAKVAAGFIIHGTKRIDIPETTFAIGGGTLAEPSYLVVRYIYGQNTASVLPSTVVGNTSILPTLTEWKQPLASFYRLNGRIKLKETLWDSIIILPSLYSPS